MKTTILGIAMRLEDVPVGGVFGVFDQGQYMRCLKTSLANSAQDHVSIISLGPFIESAGRVAGPTAFYWPADEEVVFESETTISQKLGCELSDASRSPHIPLGAIVLTDDQRVCILCRVPNAGRAMVDLKTGEPIRSAQAVAYYEHYVLSIVGEVQRKITLFDNSVSTSAISSAA